MRQMVERNPFQDDRLLKKEGIHVNIWERKKDLVFGIGGGIGLFVRRTASRQSPSRHPIWSAVKRTAWRGHKRNGHSVCRAKASRSDGRL